MRRLLLTTAVLAATLAADPAGAACSGVFDAPGDTGLSDSSVSPPVPAASLDIVGATVSVGSRVTTFRITVADLSLLTAEAPTGSGWSWALTMPKATVFAGATAITGHADTTVYRRTAAGDTLVHVGPAPRFDTAADTVSWTVPNAVLAKAGLTRSVPVRAAVETRRVAGTAAVPGRGPLLQGTGADVATRERTERWGRVGCP